MENKVNRLTKALEKIIEMNLETAYQKYGDRKIADEWACVRVAREALGVSIKFYCENGGNECIIQCEFCKTESKT